MSSNGKIRRSKRRIQMVGHPLCGVLLEEVVYQHCYAPYFANPYSGASLFYAITLSPALLDIGLDPVPKKSAHSHLAAGRFAWCPEPEYPFRSIRKPKGSF